MVFIALITELYMAWRRSSSERSRLMWFYHYQRESSKRTFQLTSGRGTTLLNNPSKFEISMCRYL